MDRNQKREGKLELRKSWQYLLYIDLVLPGLLFLAAFVTRGSSFGISLGRVFHTYGLYVSSPVPNLDPFNGTGVLGLLITLGLLLWASCRWKRPSSSSSSKPPPPSASAWASSRSRRKGPGGERSPYSLFTFHSSLVPPSPRPG